MALGIDTNGVILRTLGGNMRTFKTCRPRGLPFRLFIVLAGALLLTAALVPRANAQFTVIYFNFEDGTIGGPPDFAADVIPPLGDNPGGGIQNSTLSVTGANFQAVSGASLLGQNRTALDSDLPGVTPQIALNMNHTSSHPNAQVSFHADTTNLSQLSLSFAVNNQGNGYSFVALSFIVGGVTTNVGGQTIGTVVTTITFSSSAFPSLVGAENHPDVTFVLTFNNGMSNGNNLETVIDNIRLDALPEPATVAGGLLGVLGLCWFQRRRLIGSVRFRRS
jgi:hypothetical protein